MNLKKLFFLFCLLSFVRCTPSGRQGDSEVIVFDCHEHSSFSSMTEIFSEGRFLIPEDGGDNAMMFSEPEQIVYRNGKLYVSDWRYGKIIVYDDGGAPELCLDRKGRGPQEYLQVSYFDIDGTGNIWILDGQNDRLIQYSGDGSFICAFDLDYEVNFIRSLDDGNFLFGLAPWDDSPYKDKKVLLLDKNLKVISACIDSGEYDDPNYEFKSQGFVSAGNGIFFHTPVDDYIYCLTLEGELEKSYYVDFGPYSFPNDVRQDIESHYDEIKKYRTLVNTVYVDEDLFIGSVLDKGRPLDFIIDRRADILYLKDKSFESLYLAGICGDSAVFYIPAGYSGEIPYMPDPVKAEYDSGKDVFLILDIDTMKFRFPGPSMTDLL